MSDNKVKSEAQGPDCKNSGELPCYVRMPDSLTAENGAKALFMGEFFEHIEVGNPEYCGGWG